MAEAVLAEVLARTRADAGILMHRSGKGSARVLATAPAIPPLLGAVVPVSPRVWGTPEEPRCVLDALDLTRLVPPSVRIHLPVTAHVGVGVWYPNDVGLLLVSDQARDPLTDIGQVRAHLLSVQSAILALSNSIRFRQVADALAQVVDSLTAAVILFDGSGERARVNAAAAELLRCDSGDVSAAAATTALVQLCQRTSDPERISQEALRLLTTPGEEADHWSWDIPDGPRHLRVRTTPVAASHGPPGRMWLFDDVTVELTALAAATTARDRLVESEQQLRRQSDFLHAVLDAELEPHVYLRAIRDDSGMVIDFEYMDVNAAACDYMGMTHEELTGLRLLDVLPGHLSSGLLARYAEALDTGKPLVLNDYAYPHEVFDSERRYDIRAVPVGDGLSFAWSDVTERYEFARALAESQQQFKLLAENASDLVALATPDGVVKWISESIRNYGWDPADIIGTTIHDFIHAEEAEGLSHLNEVIGRGDEITVEWRLRHKNQPDIWHWFRVTLRPVKDADGKVIGRVSGWQNIDAERAESELVERERMRLAATLDSMLNPHIIVIAVRDAEGAVVDFEYRDANRAALTYLQVDRQELVGSRVRERYGDGSDMMMRWLSDVLETGEPLERDDVPITSAITGQERWVDVKAVRVGDEVAFTWQDVTARHESTELLRHLAGHDALTGLPNRGNALARLETLLSLPAATRPRFAVVFCDLDDMKTVNDTLGHAAGDLLLTETATRITAAVTRDDTVARFGGDEILVVLTGVAGVDDALAVAERVRNAIAEPIADPASGTVLRSTASIGLTLTHPDDTVDELIARADRAMYEAKTSGRNRVVTHP